eukprot:COSAG01_NODE_26046_length_725_cov_0.878594_1_plen_47_part_10
MNPPRQTESHRRRGQRTDAQMAGIARVAHEQFHVTNSNSHAAFPFCG